MKTVQTRLDELTKLETKLMKDKRWSGDIEDRKALMSEMQDLADQRSKLNAELSKLRANAKSASIDTFHTNAESVISGNFNAIVASMKKAETPPVSGITYTGIVKLTQVDGKWALQYTAKGGNGKKAAPGEKNDQRAKGKIVSVSAKLVKTGKAESRTSASSFWNDVLAAKGHWPKPVQETKTGKFKQLTDNGDFASINHDLEIRRFIKSGALQDVIKDYTVVRIDADGKRTEMTFNH